jgi:adenylate kinase
MAAPAPASDPAVVAAQLMADVWPQIEAATQGKPPVFPRQLVWLNGAPGAGKGTNTRTIMQVLAIEQQPVVVSDLLSSPEFIKIKNSGALVGDKDVVGLLLKKLLDPAYVAGAIVDGFPRSRAQAEFLRLLVAKLESLAAAHPGVCAKPSLRVIVLNVAEEVAVERQIKRGREAVMSNELARKLGGRVEDIRATDVDPASAAKRFRVFQEQTVGALQSLTNAFPCHFIDAGADIPTVRASIEKALGAG